MYKMTTFLFLAMPLFHPAVCLTLYTKDFVIGVFLGILFIAVATTIFMQQLYISKLAVIEETIENNYKHQSEGK